jgi:anti-sigma regulatory factor (Ser/Thr protein kinase)
MTDLADIPRDPEAPVLARSLVRSVDGRFRRDDAELLVTEVVTNAVLHGAGESIQMQLELIGNGGLRCVVVDDGDGFDPPARPQPHEDAMGGYGLMLLDRLSDAWGVRSGSTQVWFELGPRHCS